MKEINDTKRTRRSPSKMLKLSKISDKIGLSAILRFENDHYSTLRQNTHPFFLKDEDYQPYRCYDLIKIIFGVVFVIIIIAYILTIRN